MNEGAKGPKEILIVDDSDADVALFEQLLASKNPSAVVHSAGSSDEAESYVRIGDGSTPDIDLVIIDLSMPKEGGLAILKRIKSDQDLRRIPVIIFSGSESERDVERAYELGANSYLVKPVEFEEFKRVVGFIDSYWLRGLSQLPHRR
jgi:CheY-like chemotaxis protein